jgi:hypothetical protein
MAVLNPTSSGLSRPLVELKLAELISLAASFQACFVAIGPS